jgi:hypothetical protein
MFIFQIIVFKFSGGSFINLEVLPTYRIIDWQTLGRASEGMLKVFFRVLSVSSIRQHWGTFCFNYQQYITIIEWGWALYEEFSRLKFVLKLDIFISSKNWIQYLFYYLFKRLKQHGFNLSKYWPVFSMCMKSFFFFFFWYFCFIQGVSKNVNL